METMSRRPDRRRARGHREREGTPWSVFFDSGADAAEEVRCRCCHTCAKCAASSAADARFAGVGCTLS